MEYRSERDSMGEVLVPAHAYYGASTQRAVDNFPISGAGFERRFIWALGLIKSSVAEAAGRGISTPGSPRRYARPGRK